MYLVLKVLYLISKRLTNLRCSKRELVPIIVKEILEVDKYALSRLRAHKPACFKSIKSRLITHTKLSQKSVCNKQNPQAYPGLNPDGPIDVWNMRLKG